MQVKDIMTREVDLLSPDQSIKEAAQKMQKDGVGAVPVSENDRLVGMITDRDIIVRCVSQGNDCQSTQIRTAMSSPILYCYEDDSVEDACANMGKNKIRRLPVLSHEKRLVGIISLGDLCKNCEAEAGQALRDISQQ